MKTPAYSRDQVEALIDLVHEFRERAAAALIEPTSNTRKARGEWAFWSRAADEVLQIAQEREIG